MITMKNILQCKTMKKIKKTTRMKDKIIKKTMN